MARVRKDGALTRAASRINLVIAATLPFLALLAAGSAAAFGAGVALSEQDKQCLACHSSSKLEKKLPSGEILSLHVQSTAFAESVHGTIGCAACHVNIALKNHPSARGKIKSAREYSIAQTAVCRPCHDDKFKQYEGSIHASLLREGNPIAPVCSDCHSPHAVRAGAAREAIAEVPCRKCHGGVFDAYAQSVHGLARARQVNNAPLCADCHRAHDVMPASTGEQPRSACLACHEGAMRSHQTWLPNAGRHLETVSCAACHAPQARRKVDLRLYDAAAQKRIAEKAGVPQFETRARSADVKGLGLDALALQSLLKEFNRDTADANTTLRGRLEVSSGIEAHQLVDESKAIQDCATCHREGADPFQSVTVSIVGPDGRPVRYSAQKEVLSSVVSIDSVGGFYAIGGTRIKVLDMLFALALLSGIAVPAGHLALSWLFRWHARKIREQQAQADARTGRQPPSSGDDPGGGAAPG